MSLARCDAAGSGQAQWCLNAPAAVAASGPLVFGAPPSASTAAGAGFVFGAVPAAPAAQQQLAQPQGDGAGGGEMEM
jgi:hypothetical protein